MKTKLITLIVMLFPTFVLAQELRPLLNPSVACTYGSPNNSVDFETNKTKLVDYFFIVEKMPKPKLQIAEIEDMLKKNVFFIDKELNIKDKLVIQCLVNCEGKAGDYQIVYCPTEIANVCCQIFEIFKNKVTEWKAGIQREREVDVLVKIVINIDKGKIKIEKN